jgi:hypothetical protein
MRKFIIILLLFTAKVAISQKMINIQLKRQLDSVMRLDQQYREIIMVPAKQDYFAKSLQITTQQANDKAMELMMQADSTNIVFIEEVIKKYGYPGKSLVGEPTNEAAWNVIQHSTKIHQYIYLIKGAAQNNELPFRLYAMMLDRDLMDQGKEQIYGTQLRSQKMKNGKVAIFVWPIRNPSTVNKLRKEAGFDSTVEQNAKRFNVTYRVVKMDEVK